MILKKFGPLIIIFIGLIISYAWMHKSFLTPSDETGHAIGVWLISTIWSIFAGIVCLVTCFKNWSANKFLARNYLTLLFFIPFLWMFMPMSYWTLQHELVERTHAGWSDGDLLNDLKQPYFIKSYLFAALSLPLFILNWRQCKGKS